MSKDFKDCRDCEYVGFDDRLKNYYCNYHKKCDKLNLLSDGTLRIKTDLYPYVKRVLIEDGQLGTLYYPED